MRNPPFPAGFSMDATDLERSANEGFL
jgi:hypothetical protein